MAWLRFTRLPNVLTVPGDLVAGALLAGGAGWETARAVPAVCLAYVFGMMLNDCVDVGEDARERPERPLPSGAIPLPVARVACGVAGAASFALLPGIPMALLLGAVVAYSFLKKLLPPVGPALMAVCRGLSLWIGAGAPWEPSTAVAAGMAIWTGYILLVTWTAALETRPTAGLVRPGVLVAFGVAVPLVLALGTRFSPWGWIPTAGLWFGLLANLWSVKRSGRVEPRHIGRYLGLLFALQAAVAGFCGAPVWALIVALGWPAQRWCAARIPAS